MSLLIPIWEMREPAREIVIFAPCHTKLGPQFTPLDSLCHLIFLIVYLLFVLFYCIYFQNVTQRIKCHQSYQEVQGCYLISFENVEAKSENLQIFYSGMLPGLEALGSMPVLCYLGNVSYLASFQLRFLPNSGFNPPVVMEVPRELKR